MLSTKARDPLFLLLLGVLGAVVNVSAEEHIVTVGKAAHRFDPDTVYAAVGDVITYEFYPTNHSVVRGAWDFPCIPYELVTPQVNGFFAGFHPVKTIQNNPPRWSVTVNDTNPIFFYCSAPDSCNHWGMVGVVNPRQDQPLDTYRAEAKNASFVLQPGDSWPSEAQGVTTVPGSPTFATATSPPAVTVTASNTPTPTQSTATHTSSLSVGGIAGIAIGAVGVVALIGGLFFFLGRTKSQPPPPPPPAATYEKQGPVSYIAPMSPPPPPFIDRQLAYRAYSPDPRAFPPQALADDKWRENPRGSHAVEMVGSPSGEYMDAPLAANGHSRPTSHVAGEWDGRTPASTVREYPSAVEPREYQREYQEPRDGAGTR
ncbi:hypothetical protein FN846DRAFT_997864 [Sphaerosporella brunnea]|uniref:Cupredoxin n=1 Tax=Sphaerosporella brunnea TaxID=1250544 RepID=A0A5J5F5K9_9PEZI|nr:hypothetical protein FN846DRAFT_997864 [Sphaerosporella brunnea]